MGLLTDHSMAQTLQASLESLSLRASLAQPPLQDMLYPFLHLGALAWAWSPRIWEAAASCFRVEKYPVYSPVLLRQAGVRIINSGSSDNDLFFNFVFVFNFVKFLPRTSHVTCTVSNPHNS